MDAEANQASEHRKDVLLPYQVRWMADESPIKIAEKSRRIGLTWTEAAASALSNRNDTRRCVRNYGRSPSGCHRRI